LNKASFFPKNLFHLTIKKIIMRVCFEFEGVGKEPVILPLHYNHMVQSMIYSSISADLADFLHNQGFTHGKRAFKLFTFSRLIGNTEIRGKTILFHGPLRLYVSSPVQRFVRELNLTLLKRGGVRLGDAQLRITAINIPKPPHFDEEAVIKPCPR